MGEVAHWIGVAGALGLALRGRRMLLGAWAAAFTGGALLNLALKAAFQRARRTAPFIVAAASSIVLAVGFSRVYLGVRYFSDVVGGYLSGIAWLAVCVSAVEIARRHARNADKDI